MYFDELFRGYTLQTKVAAEFNDDIEERLLRQLDDKMCDLASLISAKIVRGDEETSAPYSKLGFKMDLVDYSNESI